MQGLGFRGSEFWVKGEDGGKRVWAYMNTARDKGILILPTSARTSIKTQPGSGLRVFRFSGFRV